MNVVNVTITTRLKFTRKYGITSDSLFPYDNTISMSDAGQAGWAGAGRGFYGRGESRARIKMIILTQNILLSNY